MDSQAQPTSKKSATNLPKPLRTKRKLPEFLTPGEIKLLLTVGIRSPTRSLEMRNVLLARTMYQCGLRVAEAVSLRPQDLSQGSLMVRDGKGHKDRTVPISEALEQELRTYSALRRIRADKPMFPITTRQARTIITEGAKRAGLTKDVSPNTLRHSYGRQCVLNGVPLNVLQQWLGHANIETTFIYTSLAGYATPELTAKLPTVEV